FELKIMDNGKGFETPAAAPGGRGGNGLRNMRQRMVAIGGECGIWSRVHEGTVITLWIPLEPKISANP
ncbi:MAG: cache domain-containing protein, partial [Limisphaerales bacterium]